MDDLSTLDEASSCDRPFLSDPTLYSDSCLFCQGTSPLIGWIISFETPYIYVVGVHMKVIKALKKSILI